MITSTWIGGWRAETGRNVFPPFLAVFACQLPLILPREESSRMPPSGSFALHDAATEPAKMLSVTLYGCRHPAQRTPPSSLIEM